MSQPHAQRAHAKLAPSSASRWMKCPGSVRLCAGVQETPSVFAAEGTAAHMLAETCLRAADSASFYRGGTIDIEAGCFAGRATRDEEIIPAEANGRTRFKVDAEMVEGVQLYLDVAREIKAQSDEFETEQRMDMSALVPGVFGTGDVIAYRETPTRRVTIVDLKYGKGVAVDVEENEQLLTYAVGVAQRYHNRGVDEVELVIVQPRAPRPGDSPPGVRRWGATVEELYEHVMAMQSAAKAAALPVVAFFPGDWCRFCKAAGVCTALYQKVKEIVMQDPTTPFGDWAAEAAAIEFAKGWARRREEYAHAEAIRGRLPPGAKLVHKRSNRTWKDEAAAVEALQLLGVDDDDIWSSKVNSPASVEKALPKADRKVIATLSYKPPGGTVLAPLDDPRPAADPSDASGFDNHSEDE